ncbi:MAG: PH domain-containing protein, partial [Phycisphaerales bacterium]|nr:PH domain-containing protein [Phycisphaerales bacterium]
MEQTRISAAEVVLSPGERVLFSVRPSPWMIVLRHLGWYAAMAGVLVLAWIASRTFLADLWGLVLGLWVVAVGARLLWDVLDWFFRCYTLTDRRVISSSGVLQRRVSDLPLERVQYLEATRLVRQRVVGVGTIAAGTSGLVVPEVIWAYVARWESVVAEVRREMERRLPAAIRGAGGAGGDRAGGG